MSNRQERRRRSEPYRKAKAWNKKVELHNGYRTALYKFRVVGERLRLLDWWRVY